MFNRDTKHIDHCFTESDLVSYLYDEIEADERSDIDLHLSRCAGCAEDLASFLASRFAVREWQKASFSQLTTPIITGPWDAPRIVSRETPSLAWSDRLWSLFSNRSLAFTASAFAVLALIVWGGFSFLGHKTVERANTAVEPAIPAILEDNPSVPSAPAVAAVDRDRKVEANIPTRAADVRRQVRSSVAADRQSVRPIPRTGRSDSIRTEVAKRVPNLSGIEESEDNTVRLSDLFAEVGAGN